MKYICSNCFQKYDFDGLIGFENTECVQCHSKSIQKIPVICILPDNVDVIIAGALKYAIDNGRITGDHDFNAGITGTKDTYELIAEDYMNFIKEKPWQ